VTCERLSENMYVPLDGRMLRNAWDGGDLRKALDRAGVYEGGSDLRRGRVLGVEGIMYERRMRKEEPAGV
jgi:hypothetical protein